MYSSEVLQKLGRSKLVIPFVMLCLSVGVRQYLRKQFLILVILTVIHLFDVFLGVL